MFPDMPKRRRKKKAHMIDGGQGGVLFKCKKCGWESGWLWWAENWSNTRILKGVDCQNCNKEEVNDTKNIITASTKKKKEQTIFKLDC